MCVRGKQDYLGRQVLVRVALQAFQVVQRAAGEARRDLTASSLSVINASFFVPSMLVTQTWRQLVRGRSLGLDLYDRCDLIGTDNACSRWS